MGAIISLERARKQLSLLLIFKFLAVCVRNYYAKSKLYAPVHHLTAPLRLKCFQMS